jgi:lipoate-protein ligase A
LCFTDQDPEDIVVGCVKLVGSAQRRRAGVVLQHGSVLLARSPATPELPGAAELAGVSPDAGAWADRLILALPAAMSLVPREAAWTPEWLSHAERLERTIYRSDAWTRRR